MKQRSTTNPLASVVSPYSDAPAPVLVCFSHLRWDFVWQRPQHLLSRAAKHYRVIVVEEPVYKPSVAAHMEISHRPGGITIALPVLPERLSKAEEVRIQRKLVDGLLAGEPETGRIFWYYTPMAMAFTAHLECDLCVYDNMDELSAFRGASEELLALEQKLFAKADLVFTGGLSLATTASTRSLRASNSITSPRRAAWPARSRRTRRAFRIRGSASLASSTSAWISTLSARSPSCGPTGNS
jgi:hypothetical protein